jgi:hypothetical protein
VVPPIEEASPRDALGEDDVAVAGATVHEAEPEPSVDAADALIDQGAIDAPTSSGGEEVAGAGDDPGTVIPEPLPTPDDPAGLVGSAGGPVEDPLTQASPPPVDDDLWEEADRAPEEGVEPVSSRTDPPDRHVVVIDDHAELDAGAGGGAAGGPFEQGPEAPDPAERDPAAIGATLEDEVPEPKRRWRLFRKGGE